MKNLNQLRSYVLKHPEQEKIVVLVDPHTGEMNVPQPIQEFEYQMPISQRKKQHPEQVKLYIHQGKQGVQFELLDTDDRRANLKQCDAHALFVLNETLKVLNMLLGPLYQSAKELFSHLESVQMELPNEIQMRREWHSTLSRMDAERLLENRPFGTYLLREGDAETREIEESLMSTNPQSFRCFVVTFVEDRDTIRDRLLIQQCEGWAFYDDEPNLTTYTYQKDLSDLLRTIGARWPYA